MVEIEDFARSMIGVPWVHQGRTRRGTDCIGLCVMSARAAGHVVQDRTNYGRDANGALRKELQRLFGSPARDIRPGDIAMVKFNAERHVGIVSSSSYGLTLIHACSQSRKVVEHQIDDQWRGRIVATWRTPG